MNEVVQLRKKPDKPRTELEIARNIIGKKTRIISQFQITIDSIHERLASLKAGARRKESHVARLNDYLDYHSICNRCGEHDDNCLCYG